MKFLMLVTLAGLTAAYAAETRQDRGKRVINEALAAMGGEAYLHMQDRVETGRAYQFYNGELSGLSIAHIYTRYLTPEPGKFRMRERQTYSKDESIIALYQEEGGWEITFR